MPMEALDRMLSAWRQVQEQAEPHVVVLEAESGVGKTFQVQKFYDILASDANQLYWEPGIAGVDTPDSREALIEQRKRVVDSSLCNPKEIPSWLWIGVPCGDIPKDRRFSGADAEWLFSQLEFHASAMEERQRFGRDLWRGAGEVTWSLAQLEPGIGLAGIAADMLAGFRTLLTTFASTRYSLEDGRSAALYIRSVEMFRLLAFAAKPLPLIIVLDDAHEASHSVLDFLVAAMIQGPVQPRVAKDQEWSFFEPAATPRRLPFLLIATVWPHRLSYRKQGFARWLSEIQHTGINLSVCSEDAGSFPLLNDREAKDLVVARHSWLSDSVTKKLLRRARGGTGYNPYLLMWYVVEIEDSFSSWRRPADISDDWIERLPRTPSDTARARFRHLPKAAQYAAALGALFGREFPVAPVAQSLASSSSEYSFEAVVEALTEGTRQGFFHNAGEWGESTGSSDHPLWCLRYADDFTYLFSRYDAVDQFPWVTSLRFSAALGFLQRSRDYITRDLEFDPLVPLTALCERTEDACRIYSERKSPSGDPGLLVFCRALDVMRPRIESSGRSSTAALAGLKIALVTTQLRWGPSYLIAVGASARLAASQEFNSMDILKMVFGYDDVERLLRTTLRRCCDISSRSRLAVHIATLLGSSFSKASWSEAEAALRMNIKYPEAAIALSRLLRKQGRATEATEVHLELAKEERTRLAAVHMAQHLAWVLERKDQYEEAIEVLKPVATISGHAALRLAGLLERQDRAEEAIESLRPIAKTSDHAALRLAGLLERKGLMEEAIEALRPMANTSVHAAFGLAGLFERQGLIAEAIEAVRPIAKTNDHAACRLAGLLNKQGRAKEAIEALQPMAKTSGRPAVRLAGLLEKKGLIKEAIAALRPMAKTNDHAACRLAGFLEKQGRAEEAIEALRPMAKTSDHAAVRLAGLLEKKGLIKEGIAALRPMAKTNDHAACRLAGFLEKQGRAEEAIEALQPVAETSDQAAVRLAGLLEKQGRAKEAIEALQPMAKTSDQAAVRLAGLLERQDRAKEAIAALQPMAKTSDQAALCLAGLLEKNGLIEEAIKALRPMAKTNDHAACRLAGLLEKQGRAKEAIEALQPMAETSDQAAVRLAGLLERQDRAEEAIEALQPMANTSDRAALRLAGLLERQDRAEEAIEALQPMAETSDQAAVRLAGLLEKQGRTDEAIEAVRLMAKTSDSAWRLTRLVKQRSLTECD